MAEMEKYFRLVLGSNENFNICFRDYQTFRNNKKNQEKLVLDRFVQ